MLKVFEGFKTFIVRGNAIDLAVGVVIGAAFSAVVNALVKDLLTPLIGAIAKVPDFSMMSFTVNGSTFMYGNLINALISFLLVAASIYFFVVLPMQTVHTRIHRKKMHTPTTKKCPECMSEIPLEAKRCAHCTQVIK